MPRIEWAASLSVQNEELDSQHQELFRLHNELHESLVYASPEDTSRAKQMILDAIIAYTLNHFTAEEKYLNEIRFPESDEHCRHHKEFTKKLLELSSDVKSNKTILATSLMKILRNWISDHIMVKDLEFSGFASHSRSKG